MPRDPRYDILFEPQKIGPVTAPNRFYQVPHCSGMGYLRPNTLASMRGMKAEGGWGVVCTEYCSIHETSDDTPFPYATLWDDGDVRNLSALADAVHDHGSLAGVELWHSGSYASNLLTRQPTLGVRSLNSSTDPVQCQPMDKSDIKALRQWHKSAALRARDAGFDIVYVYPAHGYLLWEFLSRSLNNRTDEYGGSLENRVRLTRELIEDTLDAVGDACAVAVRFSVGGHSDHPTSVEGDHHISSEEARDMLAAIGTLPDLWDLVPADYSLEMGSSRFVKEGALEDQVAYVKTLTGKPVVSVGRFTSPDTMASQIKNGVLDFVGAARPSIADPFLPAKIRDGHPEDIRECIGCNICYSSNSLGTPLRCTQNPTMGEEWRAGWHPEKTGPSADGNVLIVGGGPAGLEAAHILGKRGLTVALAEADRNIGGRVTRESGLAGLSEWARVRDYRLGQIDKLDNVTLYPESRMDLQTVLEFSAEHVLVATGATWRRNALGRNNIVPRPEMERQGLLTPDDIMDGVVPDGPVVVFDDDHYYMGPVIAQTLAQRGLAVTYVTSDGTAGSWSYYTEEQFRTQARLIELGVDIVVSHLFDGFDGSRARISCVYSGKERELMAGSVVMVTSREPQDGLYHALNENSARWAEAGIQSAQRIGDCRQPSLIAAAVYAGHKAGRELGIDQGSIRSDRDRVLVTQ